MKSPIILALDTKDKTTADSWISATKSTLSIYKICLEDNKDNIIKARYNTHKDTCDLLNTLKILEEYNELTRIKKYNDELEPFGVITVCNVGHGYTS